MLNTISFPSVIELNNRNLRNTAASLLSGLKLHHNNNYYTVGTLALSEGEFPHRNINSAPDETDYQLLIKSSLVLLEDKAAQPVALTLGFPYSTYNIYKDVAKQSFTGSHEIEYDPSTFSGQSIKRTSVTIDKLEVMPEIVGCMIGVRKELRDNSNFFIISVGYGTMEAVLSVDGGIVERTLISTHGINYAINLLKQELEKKYYLAMQSEHQLNEAMVRGFIILNRKKIDLREMRRQILKSYYNEIISNALRKVISDKDLTTANRIYLAGGGILYEDLVSCFREEFDPVAELVLTEDPCTLASRGYLYNSQRIVSQYPDKPLLAVGLDIGNSSTSISFSDQQ